MTTSVTWKRDGVLAPGCHGQSQAHCLLQVPRQTEALWGQRSGIPRLGAGQGGHARPGLHVSGKLGGRAPQGPHEGQGRCRDGTGQTQCSDVHASLPRSAASLPLVRPANRARDLQQPRVTCPECDRMPCSCHSPHSACPMRAELCVTPRNSKHPTPIRDFSLIQKTNPAWKQIRRQRKSHEMPSQAPVLPKTVGHPGTEPPPLPSRPGPGLPSDAATAATAGPGGGFDPRIQMDRV